MEYDEFKEREKGMREMYESMIAAFKGDGMQGDENQIKQLKEMYEK